LVGSTKNSSADPHNQIWPVGLIKEKKDERITAKIKIGKNRFGKLAAK